MNDPEDLRALKLVRAECARHGLDTSRADIRVHRGICTIRGTLAAVSTMRNADLEEEVHHLQKAIRARREIQDVVLEVALVHI